tara:strand:- start:1286 stop:1708 length:423 start_codon:yes stop_codon:yes gene_type:complete
MKTDNKYTRHLFQLEPNKFHYNLYKLHFILNGNNAITETVKIEPNRKFNNGTGFNNWLILKDQKFWDKCKCKTGLRPIKKENCFYGDLLNNLPNGNINRSLVIVQFSKDNSTMVLDYFKGLDPINNVNRFNIFNNHKFYM